MAKATQKRGSKDAQAALGDPLTISQRAFLAAYAECGNISAAARAAQVNPDQHYKVWRNNPAYWEAFEAAHEIACDQLEYEARRRAVEGVQEPVYHRGKVVGYVNKYSDALLMFLLKAERRNKFAPKSDAVGEGSLLVSLPKAVVGVDLEQM